ncbi:MAG: MBL fold metallo-hydrolase [Bacteroidaceae bacterium]|nr:MBL fold metallo-hydrolase [Bacteroidaceae bacterium]
MKKLLFMLAVACTAMLVACNGNKKANEEEANPETANVQGNYETDTFKTKSGKNVTIYALMHASVRVVYDGKEIEIDPVTKLRDRTIDYASMPKADYIFVTHEHGDHYDAEALKLLSTEKTRLIMNKRCADMYGAGQVMANGDKMQIANDFSVEAVPAYNISEANLTKHPKGRDNGYILTIDGLRIYFAGDTEDVPEMDNIKDIDVAYFPCNGPTMTVEQLVRAAKLIKPKVLFPYHFSQTDVSVIPAQLKGDGIDVRIRRF